ncbi:LysR family transcriptional regulator [Exiguobacterium artemiae]|uniref:LysR family transcriptional regulator n=1 Tax=Exiguobacterium artemiae TaxID=340145 RepID=UPI003CFD44AF
MNRAQIELIIEIAETGSFTKAGEHVHMTQPAVSRTVASIEAQLGTKLIKRDKKNGLFFTEVGEQILVILRKITSEFQKVDELVASERGLEIGKVHVGAYRTAYTRFLPKIIRTMEEQYPGLEIKLWEGTIDQIKKWLRTECVDVGIITSTDQEFDTIALAEDQLIVLLPLRHPLAAQETVSILDLKEQPLLMGKDGVEKHIYSLFEEHDLIPKVRFEMDQLETGISMVQEGLGVTITTKQSIGTLPDHVIYRELTPKTFRNIQLAVRNKKDTSKATDVFIQTALTLFTPDTLEK